MKSEPIDPVAAVPLGDYVPVALERQRHDGWTEERQRVFLCVLSETGCITEAAHAAGVTARSAYRLRAHPQGKPFGDAWDQALRLATGKLIATAYERALHGTPVRYMRDGKLVGETRAPSDRLLIYLLEKIRPTGHRQHANWNLLEITNREARTLFDEKLGDIEDSPVPIDPDEADPDEPDALRLDAPATPRPALPNPGGPDEPQA